MKIFLLLLLLIFPATGEWTARASEPIKIGVSLGLSGKYSEMADMQVKGFRLWESKINQTGGLLRRKVHLTIYDDNSDSKSAANLYEKMIVKDKMDLLFGPYSSALTTAVLPVTEKYKFPILTSGASSDTIWQKGYRYVFGIYTPASRYTAGFLEMCHMHDISRLAIISADDNFSISTSEGTKKWANLLNLDIVYSAKFTKGTDDLKSITQKARNLKAQALIMCGHFNEAVSMRKTLDQIGWYPQAYYATVGPVLESYQKELGNVADRTFSSAQWEYHPLLDFPGTKRFYDDFYNTYQIKPSYHAACAYAAGEIMAKAIEKAASLDRERIRSILSSMDTFTIIGRYGVGRSGMQIRHLTLTIQWQNGVKKIVWPEELANQKPVLIK